MERLIDLLSDTNSNSNTDSNTNINRNTNSNSNTITTRSYMKYKSADCDLTHNCAVSSMYDPIVDIREFPLNPQYSGYHNVDMVYTLWSRLLVLLYPSISFTYTPHREFVPLTLEDRVDMGLSPGLLQGSRVNIRIGIVAESGSNSSPLLCLYVSYSSSDRILYPVCGALFVSTYVLVCIPT